MSGLQITATVICTFLAVVAWDVFLHLWRIRTAKKLKMNCGPFESLSMECSKCGHRAAFIKQVLPLQQESKE